MSENQEELKKVLSQLIHDDPEIQAAIMKESSSSEAMGTSVSTVTNDRDSVPRYVLEIQAEISSLENKIQRLEDANRSITKQHREFEESLPVTWLQNHNILKRAFGVFGLSLLAYLILSLGAFVLGFIGAILGI